MFSSQDDVASAAVSKAEAIGGSTRLIHRPPPPRKRTSTMSKPKHSQPTEGVDSVASVGGDVTVVGGDVTVVGVKPSSSDKDELLAKLNGIVQVYYLKIF